ncbi:D-alanyl-D-alanine carboxypeptidase [Streptomyces gottesmaniae]
MSRPSTPRTDQATAVFSRRALLEAAEAEGLKLDDATPDADADADAVTDAPATGSGAAKTAGSRTAGTRRDEPESDRSDARDAEDRDEAGSDAAQAGAEGAGAEDSNGAQSDAGTTRTEADGPEPTTAASEDTDTEPAAGDEGRVEAEAEDDEVEDGDAHPRERGAAAPASDPDAAATADGDEAEAEDGAKAADAARAAAAGEEAGPEAGAAPDGREAVDGAGGAAGDGAHGAGDARVPGDGAGEAADDARELADDEPVADGEPEAADDVPGAPDDAPELADGEPDPADDEPVAVDDAPEARHGARESADDEPVAADGGEAPQGPPAGDDESRTGGAGGGAVGDGGAEARRAVDQPTAIFRAPRVPAVDQPTTMLKLGDAAPKDAEPARTDAAPRDAEPARTDARPDRSDVSTGADGDKGADDGKGAHGDKGAQAGVGVDEPAPPTPAERTSKFVALKSLDESTTPRPPAGAPPAPAEATRTIPQVGPERTTQQPLPPKPPLDLLAELTNTPPPRQTPVRTIIRKVKIWTPLVILLVIVFAVAQAVRPLPTPTLTLTADASYAFEGDKVTLPWPDEGQGWMDVNGIGTMDSFGEQKPVAIGSVAKAMTAYVILKEHPMKAGSKGATIPVDAKAETEGGYDKDGESTLNTVKEGDELSQYDAIAAIMIPSANNIARLLARWDSKGSEEEFVKKMNAAAKDLGMKNTTYTDPSGLKETTVSTAEDQVKLGNELVKMKALTDITRLPSWKDPSGQPWSNYNRLVPYDNAIGIKTGSTTAAGGNLLFAATKDVGGETAIVVGAILGQHTPPIIDTVNAVSKTAMLAAQDAVTSDTILKKGDVVGYVDDGLGGQTPVVATKNVSAVGWAGKTVKLELDASAAIPHEAESGTEVGTLIVGDGAGEGVEVPVALQKPLTEPGFLTKLTRVS